MKRKKFPNILTFLNLLFGTMAILFSIRDMFVFSAASIIIAVAFDYLDGKIARLLKAESKLGEELDSLADLVSFGVAPSVLLFAYYNDTILAVLLLFFILGGAFRLARFNILKSKVKGFIGMPITVNGILFPVLVLLKTNIYLIMILVVISTILMVSTIKLKKVL